MRCNKEFKAKIVDCLAEDQQMKSKKAWLCLQINKIFPDENFFAYKTCVGFSEEKKKQENQEIKRLIDKITQEGGFEI